MWNRLKRLFRSVFGGLIDSAEDPELILQQLVRDMNDEVPKMRENVAQVMATEKRLEREIQANQAKLTDLATRSKLPFESAKTTLPPRCSVNCRLPSAHSPPASRIMCPPKPRHSRHANTSTIT